jgi:hypothetical protein
VWDANITYPIGTVVQTDNGDLWKSVTAQSGNAPDSDDGTNWRVAVLTNTVIPQTGGGLLTALRTNELQDSGAYTLPLANSVLVNQTIIITLPDRYGASTPTVTISGSDTITNIDGTDTSITFVGSAKLNLTSDGVSNWSL